MWILQDDFKGKCFSLSWTPTQNGLGWWQWPLLRRCIPLRQCVQYSPAMVPQISLYRTMGLSSDLITSPSSWDDVASSTFSVLHTTRPPMDWRTVLSRPSREPCKPERSTTQPTVGRVIVFLPHYYTSDALPGELFLQRKLQTKVDLLKPDQERLVTSRQAAQKIPSHKYTLRSLAIGSADMVRNYWRPYKWVPGTIVWKLGPVTYQVDLGRGNLVKCHIEQLTKRSEPLPQEHSKTDEPQTTQHDYFQYPDTTDAPNQEQVDPLHNPPDRYPQRVREPPDRCITFPFSWEETVVISHPCIIQHVGASVNSVVV